MMRMMVSVIVLRYASGLVARYSVSHVFASRWKYSQYVYVQVCAYPIKQSAPLCSYSKTHSTALFIELLCNDLKYFNSEYPLQHHNNL